MFDWNDAEQDGPVEWSEELTFGDPDAWRGESHAEDPSAWRESAPLDAEAWGAEPDELEDWPVEQAGPEYHMWKRLADEQ